MAFGVAARNMPAQRAALEHGGNTALNDAVIEVGSPVLGACSIEASEIGAEWGTAAFDAAQGVVDAPVVPKSVAGAAGAGRGSRAPRVVKSPPAALRAAIVSTLPAFGERASPSPSDEFVAVTRGRKTAFTPGSGALGSVDGGMSAVLGEDEITAGPSPVVPECGASNCTVPAQPGAPVKAARDDGVRNEAPSGTAEVTCNFSLMSGATSKVKPAMSTRNSTDWPPHVVVRQLMLHATPHRAQHIMACKTLGEQLVELSRRAGWEILLKGNDKFDPLMVEAVSSAIQCYYFKVPIAKVCTSNQRTSLSSLTTDKMEPTQASAALQTGRSRSHKALLPW